MKIVTLMLQIKPIFKRRVAIGKPERPKRYPIWAAHLCTHLSTKCPSPWDAEGVQAAPGGGGAQMLRHTGM